MPDIKILIFIGIIVYQFVRFLMKQSAKMEKTTPKPEVPLEEIFKNKKDSQGRDVKKASNNRSEYKKKEAKRAPIFASESYNNVQDKFNNLDQVETPKPIYQNYETDSNWEIDTTMKHYDGFELEKPKNIYLDKIRDPQSFKEAFVIGEILNNKYQNL